MDMSDLKNLFGAVNNGLSFIKSIADVPGVNLIPYVSTVSSAIGALQFAYEKGVKIADHVAAFKDTFQPGVIPSQDKLDALDVKIAELRAAVHAPLPPKEDGEDE